MKQNKKLKLNSSAQERYEQAVEVDKANIFTGIQAPSLFNWFVGLTSIVVGLSLGLFSRINQGIEIGRFTAWFLPLLIIFILAGVGLLLSETIEKKGRRWRVIFRLILAVAFGSLALIRFAGADFEGTFMTMWLAVVILFNVVADISSLRSYFIYFLGLFIGLPLVIVTSGINPVWGFILTCLAIAYVCVTGVSYFKNKSVFTYLIAVAGLPLVVLAFVYASDSDWVRAFLTLMTGLFAFLLPFWDELRFRMGTHRNWVTSMFSVLLGLFVTTIVLIKVLQNILIASTYMNLADKLTYGRVLAESTINNTLLSIKSLAGSEVLIRALTLKESSDLVDLSRGFFESNPNLLRIVTVDNKGKILSAYPLSAGLVGKSLRAMDSSLEVSNVIVSADLEIAEPTIAISVPVTKVGREVGRLIGYLDLRSLSDSLQEIATPAQNQTFVLMDGKLNWITGPGVPQRKRSGDPLVTNLRQSGIVREGYSQEGELIIAASDNIPKIGWKLILIEPLSLALAVNQIAYVVILAITSLAVLIIGVTVLLERVGSKRTK